MRVGRDQLQPQRRRGDREQHRGGTQRDGAGPAHHALAEPEPDAFFARRAPSASALRCSQAGASEFTPRSERDEHRRQHDQRDDPGRQRTTMPPMPIE